MKHKANAEKDGRHSKLDLRPGDIVVCKAIDLGGLLPELKPGKAYVVDAIDSHNGISLKGIPGVWFYYSVFRRTKLRLIK